VDKRDLMVPLKHELVSNGFPGIVRILPILYNHWYRVACLRLLRERTPEEFEQAWRLAGIPAPLTNAVVRIVRDEYCWPSDSLFLPDDECFVVFWNL